MLFSLKVNATQHFKTASAVPTQELISELQSIYDNQIKNKNVQSIRIEGNTDQRGSDVYNLILSEKRATSVKEVLIKMGTDKSLFKSVFGKGESELLTTGTSAEDYTKHRRVVVIVDAIANVVSECKCEVRKNRISLLAGRGSKPGLDRSSTSSVVSVESEVGAVAGLQYQRLITKRVNVGIELLTNKTGLLSIGLDF